MQKLETYDSSIYPVKSANWTQSDYYAYGSPMPMRRNLVQCSVVSTYDTAIAYSKNEDFNSGGTGGFTASTGTVSNPTGYQLHMTANWSSKPLSVTSVYLVNGRSYTLNLDIVGFSVVSGFSHTVRVRVVLPGAAFNTDFTTTGTKTITFTSNTTGYVNIEIRSIISPPTGVYSGNPYIDIDNFKVSWDSAFTSSDTVCVSRNGYRYGFNGMEKVDEIAGEGNDYDFGARIYESRLGRWFSVDPMSDLYYPISPYSISLNNSIYYIDVEGNWIKGLDGKKVTYTETSDGRFAFSSNAPPILLFIANALLKTESGKKTLDRWINSSTKVKLKYNTKRSPSDKRKAETRKSFFDNLFGLKKNGEYRKITITFFDKTIKESMAKSEKEDRFGGASFEEVIGAVAVHEDKHGFDKRQIELDKKLKEEYQPEDENIAVNAEILFREEYREYENKPGDSWKYRYENNPQKKVYKGLDGDGNPKKE